MFARSKIRSAILALTLPLLCPPAWAGILHWTSIGPPGGTVRAPIPHPKRPALLFLLNGGQVVIGRGGGDRWEVAYDLRMHGEASGEFLLSLSFDPLHTGRVWVLSSQGRVLGSDDFGAHWAEIYGLDGPVARLGDVQKLTFDPGTPGTVYALSLFALAKSTDGGASWSVLSLPQLPGVVPQLAELFVRPDRPSTLYLATFSHGLLRSTNGGASFALANNGLGGSSVPGLRFAFSVDRPTSLYGLNPIDGRLWRSTDGASRWRLVSGPNVTGAFPDLALLQTPDATRLYGLQGGTLVTSDDQGVTWHYLGTRQPALIELAPSPQSAAILYAGSAGGGIFRTGDGGAHWQTLPYSAPEVLSSFAVDPRGSSTLWVPSPYFERHNLFEPAVPGLYNGLWLSREGGASWLSPVDQPSLRGTAGGGIAWASSPPFSLYLGSRQGVLHSEDGGRSWSSTFVSSCHNFTALEVAPSDSQRVFALGSAELYPRPCPFLPGAFRSRDGGASWQATTFFPVAIDPLDPDVIYTTANTLSRSTDDGASFVGIAAGLPGGGVKDLAIDPANTDTLYAATLLGVFKSTSAGASWAPASNGLPAGTIDRLAIDPNAPERLYAVAGPRVFTSDDGAASWAEMSTGLPALDPVLDLHVDPVHSNVIYASVAGRGLFRYTRLAPTSLTPGPETLYFSHVRFEAHVAWRDFAGREGRGQARQLTPDSGAFWFFNDQNLELFVKVLDGTGLNGSFWVFFAGLSNVEYRLDVLDTATGELRTYFNPESNLASRGDTSAFPQGGGGNAASQAGQVDSRALQGFIDQHSSQILANPTPEPLAADGSCVLTATALCLQGNRFRVELSWRDFIGRSGAGLALPFTGDTGTFWFFNPDNVEVVVKVVDGRDLNQHFWVFAGSLSSVEYTLTVTDTVTGAVKTYRNRLGTLASRADTAAF